MTQVSQIVEILKVQLKAAGITYGELAKQLNVSEASVKRLFSVQEMSLSRLESICDVLNMRLSDLFELFSQQQPMIKHLTLSQEQQLVKEVELMLVAVSVMNHWQFDDILDFYQMNQHQLIQKLAILDKMQLLILLPGNRIKSLLHPNFEWLEGGPIQQFFNDNLKRDFFNSSFSKTDACLIVRSGMLSEGQLQSLQNLLRDTAKTFVDTCKQERKTPIDKKQGSVLVMALRPWIPKAFEERKRIKN
mgnify:CR=1 FL=1